MSLMIYEKYMLSMKSIPTMLRAIILLFLALISAFVFLYSGKLTAQEPSDSVQEFVPAGPLMTETIHFQYAVYYLPSPSDDPQKILRQLLAEEKNGPAIVEKIPETINSPIIGVRVSENPRQDYAPPSLESLKYFGHGLTHQQAEQLQQSHFVIVMDFAHDNTHVWEGLRAANRITEELARRTGGVVWDEESRELFTPEEWRKRRIKPWLNDGVPDISKYITIHAYNSGEYVRAITLGMSKFGLPDVVIGESSWSRNRSIGHLINLFCQALAEGAVIKKSGEYDLDIREIQNREVRDFHLKSLISKATAVAKLTLKKGIWEDGDPHNRLIEVAFDRYAGGDVHARQEKMIGILFGSEDGVVRIKHDEELLAASRRAKEKLPMLKKKFTEGLDPGGYILVKAPFKTPKGGNEWMWVEVTEWKGNNIKGLLDNEPFYVPSLHGGQMVEVKQEDVFDYIVRHPDGTQEGNETGEIIKKMQ